MMTALASGILLGLFCGIAPGPLLALVLMPRRLGFDKCSVHSYVLESAFAGTATTILAPFPVIQPCQ